MRSSHYRHGQDKTRDKTVLSCLISGVNRIGGKSRLISVVLTAFRDWTKQFQNFLLPTVLSCRQFCSHCRHSQDKTVLSCLCRRCELGMRWSKNHVALVQVEIRKSQPKLQYLFWRFDLIMRSSSEEAGTQFFRVLMQWSAVASREWSFAWLNW